jgi:hypothetical protein
MMWLCLIAGIACSLLFSYFYNVACGIFPYPKWVVGLAELFRNDDVIYTSGAKKKKPAGYGHKERPLPPSPLYEATGHKRTPFDDFVQNGDKHRRDLDQALLALEDIAKKKAMLTAGPPMYLHVEGRSKATSNYYKMLGLCSFCHQPQEACELYGCSCRPEPTPIPGGGIDVEL